jgi:hypothetical protein
MNSRIYWITLTVLLAGMAASCNKSTLITYNAPDDIYFDYRRGVNLAASSKGFPEDSLDFTFSFSSPDVKEYLLPLPLLIAGKPADHDRVINLVIDPASTAVKDKHYVLPTSLVVRAGHVADTIFIRLLRDPGLKNSEVSLLLKLSPNENFGTSLQYKYRDISSSAKDTIDLTSFRLKISDMLVKGQLWDIWFLYYFGPYSEKKVRLMNQVTGLPLNFWAGTSLTNDMFSLTAYYATLMGRYLREQAAAGNTIYESDGVTPMQMDPAYQ